MAIVEKKMETTLLYSAIRGVMEILEKRTETTIMVFCPVLGVKPQAGSQRHVAQTSGQP